MRMNITAVDNQSDKLIEVHKSNIFVLFFQFSGISSFHIAQNGQTIQKNYYDKNGARTNWPIQVSVFFKIIV